MVWLIGKNSAQFGVLTIALLLQYLMIFEKHTEIEKVMRTLFNAELPFVLKKTSSDHFIAIADWFLQSRFSKNTLHWQHIVLLRVMAWLKLETQKPNTCPHVLVASFTVFARDIVGNQGLTSLSSYCMVHVWSQEVKKRVNHDFVPLEWNKQKEEAKPRYESDIRNANVLRRARGPLCLH